MRAKMARTPDIRSRLECAGNRCESVTVLSYDTGMRLPTFAAAMPTLLFIGFGLAGCSTLPAGVSAAETVRLAAMDYPDNAKYGEDLEVIVTREGRFLHLHNTGITVKRDCVLWVNRQYAASLPLLAIGTANVVDLTTCVNRHEEPYPVGCFLRPDLDKRVVLTDLFDPATGLRHRFTTRPPRDPYSEK